MATEHEYADRTEAVEETSGRVRLAGYAAIVGAALTMNATAWWSANPDIGPATPGFETFYGLLAVAGILMLAAAAGVYVAYRDRYGTVGLVGNVLVAIGLIVMTVNAALSASTATDPPALFLGTSMLLLGTTALGFALWRTAVDRFTAVLLIAAFPALVAEILVGESVFDLLGYELLFMVTGVVTFLGWILLGNRMRTLTAVEPVT